ncbi:hypothetical protein RP300_00210 [Oligella urethralis]|nr:hypothetical protein RP300_00210 [Oligella urethralis]SUA57337.1 Uncharacterised protein [Oligella urethralis]
MAWLQALNSSEMVEFNRQKQSFNVKLTIVKIY